MGDKYLEELKKRLTEGVKYVEGELAKLQVGRAKPALIEKVPVEAYGTTMELREVGTISAPDTNLLVVTPWDKGLVETIAKAIQAANLGFNAVVDGEVVKVPIPPLTEERRREMVRIVKEKVEEGKVALRQVRSEVKEKIEKLEGEKGVSEDDIREWLKELQRIFEEYQKQLEQLAKEKEEELLTI